MKLSIATVIMSSLTVAVCAASPAESDSTRRDRLDHGTLNYLYNIWSGTENPVSLSFNKVRTFAEADLVSHFERGAYHSVSEGSKQNNYSLDISGLKQIGRFSLSGNIKYSNIKDFSRCWNSTLYLSPFDPFVIGDSVKSDITTEQFDLHAGAAYRFSDDIIAALKLRYLTGSLSDQTDPRPKTDAMHFIINPGFYWKMSDSHVLGATAGFNIYRSSITHSVINNYISNIYFLMRGMGDSQIFTTNDVLGYPRDYKGLRFRGNLEWEWKISPAAANILELGGSTNSEKATDGGSAYTYKGGDYSATDLTFYDRFSLSPGDRYHHNISLRGSYTSDKGYWYYQKRMTDPDHSNRTYFEILGKNKVHKSTTFSPSLLYRIDVLRAAAEPDWSAQAGLSILYRDETHYEETVSEQKYTLATVSAEGTKYFRLKALRLSATVGGAYRFSDLSDPTFASVRGKLLKEYTAPAFEYATANTTTVTARLKLDIPLRLYSTPSWLSVFAGGDCRIYGGRSNAKYSDIYNDKTRTYINIGTSLIL